MANLDSRANREGGFNPGLPFGRPLPTPDGSDAATRPERAHLVMAYSSDLGLPSVGPPPIWIAGSVIPMSSQVQSGMG